MHLPGEPRRDIVPPHARQVTVTDPSDPLSPLPPGGRDAGEQDRGVEEQDGSVEEPDGTAGEPEQVIVLPPPKDDDPTWRRPWRGPGGIPWWAPWLVVPVLLLAAFGLYEAGQQGWLDPGGQAAQARPEASETRRAAAERAEATRRFRQVADSLRSAVDDYAVRRSDFERNRIDCASLAAGYRRVDRRFVSLSVLLRERGDRLDAGAGDRYEELTGQVDEVNRHFDGTGCREGG